MRLSMCNYSITLEWEFDPDIIIFYPPFFNKVTHPHFKWGVGDLADSFILMNTMYMAGFFVGYQLDLFASCYDTVSR